MSDRDQWPDNPNDPPPRRSKSREESAKHNGCLKFVLIVGGMLIVAVLVCCGGLLALGWSLFPHMAQTPAEVAAVSDAALKMNISENFIGETGMSIDNWLMTMNVALFRDRQGQGTLLIGTLFVKLGDPVLHREDFKNKIGQQSDEIPETEITESVEREFAIRGKTIPFQFSEAVEKETGKKIRLVSAELEFPKQITIFQLLLDDDAYDESTVVKMIESIE